MNDTSARSAPGRFPIDVIALAVVSLVLLFGGTQSGIATPTFTWVTGVLVLTGLCVGFRFWRYSTGNGQGSPWSHRSGYPLALALIGVLAFGLLWVTFVPPEYGYDLVYGVLTMIWTAFTLSYAT